MVDKKVQSNSNELEKNGKEKHRKGGEYQSTFKASTGQKETTF